MGKNNDKQYTITLSERQLKLLAYACRVTDRLILGQLDFSLQECCESAFEKLHKDDKAYEKVIYAFVYGCKEFAHEVWTAGIYSHYDKDLRLHCLVSGTLVSDDKILSYWGNEDKLGKTVI